jgi:hypothetical protein
LSKESLTGRIIGVASFWGHRSGQSGFFYLLDPVKPSIMTAPESADKIITLKKLLKENEFRFGNITPVILTDSGGEFSRVSAF